MYDHVLGVARFDQPRCPQLAFQSRAPHHKNACAPMVTPEILGGSPSRCNDVLFGDGHVEPAQLLRVLRGRPCRVIGYRDETPTGPPHERHKLRRTREQGVLSVDDPVEVEHHPAHAREHTLGRFHRARIHLGHYCASRGNAQGPALVWVRWP